MRILVLGYGNIGSILAKDLAESMPSAEIVVAGRNQNSVKEAIVAIDKESVTGIQLDAQYNHLLVDAMKKFDLVVGTLPANIGCRSVEAAIDAEVDMVDVSYMPENPLTLNEEATEAGVTIVPDCGVTPGISNLLVGHALSMIDEAENIHILVGGLPEEPIPPLGYVVTWSVGDLLEEYTRKARIIENGKLVEVEALTGLEEVEFPGVDKLEGFYTDGLRTLLHTVKGVKSMWEKTLRYPGHAEKIRLLETLGFFDEAAVEIGNVRLSPRILTAELLRKRLQRPEVRDILVMEVEVNGTADGSKKGFVYRLLDQYDTERGITAMARTTAYPASIVGQLIAKKTVKEKGVIPLERLGMNDGIFNEILTELGRRRVRIVESVH